MGKSDGKIKSQNGKFIVYNAEEIFLSKLKRKHKLKEVTPTCFVKRVTSIIYMVMSINFLKEGIIFININN